MKLSLFRDFGAVALVVIGVVAILVLNIPAVNSGVKNAIYLALGPVQRNIWAAGGNIGSFLENMGRMNSAVSENEQLRRQVNDLMARVSELEAVKEENNFLRQGLNLEMDKDFDLKLANVVAKNVAQDVIIVDKGAGDLVEQGMPVVTSQRAIVGRVSKVYDRYSEVTLVTAKNFSFDVKIGEEGVDGLVKGNGINGAMIDLVPKDKELKDGVAVSTSQLGGIFPAGLFVGTVAGVNSSDIETFQSSGIALAFDVNETLQVFVASAKLPIGLGDSGSEELQ